LRTDKFRPFFKALQSLLIEKPTRKLK